VKELNGQFDHSQKNKQNEMSESEFHFTIKNQKKTTK